MHKFSHFFTRRMVRSAICVVFRGYYFSFVLFLEIKVKMDDYWGEYDYRVFYPN